MESRCAALPPALPERTLLAAEVADLLRVGVRQLRRWVAGGQFPRPIRITHQHVVWDASDVARFLERRKAV